MPNPVVGWQIDAVQPERMIQFYTGLFGWTTGGTEHVQPLDSNSPDGMIGGIHGTHDPSGGGLLTVQVKVHDVQAYLDKAVHLGGEIVDDVHVVGEGLTIARFADPEGNTMLLISDPQAPAEDPGQ